MIKNSIIPLLLLILVSTSCDKISKPYPFKASLELDTTLYPGLWSEYESTEWPTFVQNTNVNRNVMIEDFTGHKCTFCPNAAVLAEQLEHDNPGRVFVASIHSGPTGKGDFQKTDAEYPVDFTNPEGLAIGTYFGTNDGGFSGNPRGTINRVLKNGVIFQGLNQWTSMTNSVITENDLKVNLQAKVNYYDQTRGSFLHVEIDTMGNFSAKDLAVVVYLIQDSLIGDQKMQDNSHNTSYVHRDIHRGCIDGKAFGRDILSTDKNQSTGKYNLNYSYKLPAAYKAEDMHLLVYVYNKSTFEIYHVIKQTFK